MRTLALWFGVAIGIVVRWWFSRTPTARTSASARTNTQGPSSSLSADSAFAPINYYALLGVAPTATANEIKAAYRARIGYYHPDRNPTTHANAVAALLNEAGEVLTNSERRRLYDAELDFSTSGSDQSEPGGMPEYEFNARRPSGTVVPATSAPSNQNASTPPGSGVNVAWRWVFTILALMVAPTFGGGVLLGRSANGRPGFSRLLAVALSIVMVLIFVSVGVASFADDAQYAATMFGLAALIGAGWLARAVMKHGKSAAQVVHRGSENVYKPFR